MTEQEAINPKDLTFEELVEVVLFLQNKLESACKVIETLAINQQALELALKAKQDKPKIIQGL